VLSAAHKNLIPRTSQGYEYGLQAAILQCTHQGRLSVAEIKHESALSSSTGSGVSRTESIATGRVLQNKKNSLDIG